MQDNACDLVADGVFCGTFVLGQLPPTIKVDWWQSSLDGDLPIDVAIDIQPMATTGLTGVVFRLDSRWNQLSSFVAVAGARPGRAADPGRGWPCARAVHDLRRPEVATYVLVRQIQGVVGTWWCGQQSPREIDDVARELRLSPAEKSKIEKAGRGLGLLVTLEKRVWLDLFQKASPEEYAMAHMTRIGPPWSDVDDCGRARRMARLRRATWWG